MRDGDIYTGTVKPEKDLFKKMKEESAVALSEGLEGLQVNDDKIAWKHGSEPPKGLIGKWTKNVVVVTNFGDVFLLAYFNGEDGGKWQKPARFNGGEEVEWWIERPAD